jgi:hypothetical protein
MRNRNDFLAQLLSFSAAVFFIIWLIVWKPIYWLGLLVRRIAIDIAKSMYAKVIAGLAAIALAALSLQFFGSLIH